MSDVNAALIQHLYLAAEADDYADACPESPDVALYVGGDAYTVQRRRCFLVGRRMFSGAYGPVSRFQPEHVPHVRGMLDSGAFSDPPEARLTPDTALERQLAWEERARHYWNASYVSEAVVSYDLLIDEKWLGGTRKKQRWTVVEADRAVRVTVEAAAYLSSQRERIQPRRLVLAVQGVDATQYAECASGVLAHAQSEDVLGLGGWCILGLYKRWLPIFWDAMRRTLPLARAAGLTRAHIFGVLYPPALGGLLWLCDRQGIALSTDSSGPILQTTWKDQSKSGALAATWEENVSAWTRRLATLRTSKWYLEPPAVRILRQAELWETVP